VECLFNQWYPPRIKIGRLGIGIGIKGAICNGNYILEVEFAELK
jgi:hypothetical protein